MKKRIVGTDVLGNPKGITLIALIITIIVMLILAAVVIAIIINGGLFEQAERSKIEIIKGQYHERLYAATMAKYTEKRGKVSRDEIKEFLEEERRSGREDWIANGNAGIKIIDPDDNETIIVTSKEGYIFHVVVKNEDGSIEIVNKGEGEPPKDIPILDEDLETGNIKFIYSPSEWTNGNVTVTIDTEITGYTIQYSKTGIKEDWTDYANGIEYTENGEIYARLTDGIDVSNVAVGNIKNIDKINPVVGTITSTAGGGTFEATDVGSGIVAYGYSTSNSIEPSNWTTIAAATNLTNGSITGITGNSAYYIWVKDQTGNTGNKSFTTLAVPVTAVTVSPTTATIYEGGTQTLTATVLPSNSTNKTLTWSSNNTSVATVSNGVVTGKAAGTAIITVTSGGKSGTCTVTVVENMWIETSTNDPDWYKYVDIGTGTIGPAAAPVISEGLTPIKYTAEPTGTNVSKWANAKTINGSMLVWIPRYEYKITSGYHSSQAGVIDVNFIPLSKRTPSPGFTIHPAFTNTGNKGLGELAGIWVGKFESSSENGEAGKEGEGLKSVPFVEPYKYVELFIAHDRSTAFAPANGITAYDSHAMKNTEWGAVAYLAHSKYGRNGEKIVPNTYMSPTRLSHRHRRAIE